MSTKAKSSRVKRPSFAVGGKVYVLFGRRKRVARIIEDRGGIGIGGRQPLRVVFVGDRDAIEQAFEIPAADVTHAKSSTPPRGKSKVKVA